MKLKLNPEYINTTFYCPITGKLITAMFIEKNMYIHYWNRGIRFIFIEEKEKKKNDISK